MENQRSDNGQALFPASAMQSQRGTQYLYQPEPEGIRSGHHGHERLSEDSSRGRTPITEPPHSYRMSVINNPIPAPLMEQQSLGLMNWETSSSLYLPSAYRHALPASEFTPMSGGRLPLPMDILSAESYNPGVAAQSHSHLVDRNAPRTSHNESNPVPMPFGMTELMDNDTKTNPDPLTEPAGNDKKSVPEAIPKRRRKSKTTVPSDEDEKKSRGRPRLDPKDETAADVSNISHSAGINSRC
jgi:hypothetical protein